MLSSLLSGFKALLDLEKIKLDGESVIGLEDQIKKLTVGEDSKFLFDVKTDEKPNFKGIVPGEKGDQGANDRPLTLADAIKLHYEKGD